MIIFGKQIRCTQLSHHTSLPWREEGWLGGLLGSRHLLPRCVLVVLQPLALRLLHYSPVPGATNTFLMNEPGLFCAQRCTSLRILHLVSSLTFTWSRLAVVMETWQWVFITLGRLLSRCLNSSVTFLCALCHFIIASKSWEEAVK